jgi:hypothetical protein
MNKKLEELFNLGDTDTDSEPEKIDSESEIVPQELITSDTLKTIERIEAALPQVRGLESSDAELDELADLAKKATNDLLDLGMQVDSRFSAEIFNSASSMLGHAISAKIAKTNKKLKMIDLQLKKAEIDRKIAVQQSREESSEEVVSGVAQVIDRNDLLNDLLAKAREQSKQK